MRCVVTGATGYIGGRLAPRLVAEGHTVRCVVRTPAKTKDIPWAQQDGVEVVRGDVLDPDSMREACEGAEVLYYLVHSLSESGFAEVDRRAALITAEAARTAGIRRIVYLGGIHPEGVELSEHLSSRTEVGEIFLRSGVPTAVLQAAVILGSGSASFEMLRYLTERLPVMLTPSWVHHRVQPIAIRDVLHYLTRVVDLPPEVNRTFDIGGPDVLTYLQMMEGFAEVEGLPRRTMLPVPVLTPRLSSHWVNLVTPVPRSTAVPLIDSLVHEVVAAEHDIDTFVDPPAEGLTSFRTAVDLALTRIREGQVETRWSGANARYAPSDPMPSDLLPSDPDWAGGTVYTDVRERGAAASAETLWHVIAGIGGDRGWYSFPLGWRARGVMDRLVGGVGLRRGRRDADRLKVGDALDWWRVEECVEGSNGADGSGAAAAGSDASASVADLEDGEYLLRLRAEMKAPGLAWLELRVAPRPGGSLYRQRAVFLPRGLAGHAYWWVIAPFHVLVFGGMERRIVAAAELEEHRGPLAEPATGRSPVAVWRRRRRDRALRDAEKARRR
ncbi:SDR family oxidoreductase [Actinomycetospora sp. TBRC 11914]|uniref:SDR family oxidoreductase n=1 Tax=Actinomycetospora sp. TBRC 11914 TaxID=2729387 RepID=UPI00145F9798|nr:SDR family oxidoreductase [Actinomycetospora sp. TBRC 11914]NMO93495.1 SDR family oxidoreductase [Actinomycetospora sp. TBRC 11914]